MLSLFRPRPAGPLLTTEQHDRWVEAHSGDFDRWRAFEAAHQALLAVFEPRGERLGEHDRLLLHQVSTLVARSLTDTGLAEWAAGHHGLPRERWPEVEAFGPSDPDGGAE